MNKSSVLLFAILIALSFCSVTPAFGDVPQVRNVNIYNVGGSTILNITVYHSEEVLGHFVDKIRVSFGTNTTDMSIGVQSLAPDSTFNITYKAGPIVGTPTATVQAECIIHSWSTTNWSGQIPEYTLPLLLIILALATTLTTFLARKTKSVDRD